MRLCGYRRAGGYVGGAAEGNADVGRSQRRCVVDPVADEQDGAPAVPAPAHLGRFILR